MDIYCKKVFLIFKFPLQLYLIQASSLKATLWWTFHTLESSCTVASPSGMSGGTPRWSTTAGVQTAGEPDSDLFHLMWRHTAVQHTTALVATHDLEFGLNGTISPLTLSQLVSSSVGFYCFCLLRYVTAPLLQWCSLVWCIVNIKNSRNISLCLELFTLRRDSILQSSVLIEMWLIDRHWFTGT